MLANRVVAVAEAASCLSNFSQSVNDKFVHAVKHLDRIMSFNPSGVTQFLQLQVFASAFV